MSRVFVKRFTIYFSSQHGSKTIWSTLLESLVFVMSAWAFLLEKLSFCKAIFVLLPFGSYEYCFLIKLVNRSPDHRCNIHMSHCRQDSRCFRVGVARLFRIPRKVLIVLDPVLTIYSLLHSFTFSVSYPWLIKLLFHTLLI